MDLVDQLDSLLQKMTQESEELIKRRQSAQAELHKDTKAIMACISKYAKEILPRNVVLSNWHADLWLSRKGEWFYAHNGRFEEHEIIFQNGQFVSEGVRYCDPIYIRFGLEKALKTHKACMESLTRSVQSDEAELMKLHGFINEIYQEVNLSATD